jgi:hypothetical protein
MASTDQLLREIKDLESSIDLISNPPAVLPITCQPHLARGIAVQALTSVETFLKARSEEWVAALKAARIPPSHLPGGTSRFENRIVEVLAKNLRDVDASQRGTLLNDVGSSLTSLSGGILTPHVLAFLWTGSNLHESDLEATLALLGVDVQRGWSELTALWGRFDPKKPSNGSLKKVFTELAALRHEAAHASTPVLPLPNLVAIPRNVRTICASIDGLGSAGVAAVIRRGSGTTAISIRGQDIRLRKIRQDGARWPEYPPGSKIARRRHPNLETAINEAWRLASARGEMVIVLDRTDEIVDWRAPS